MENKKICPICDFNPRSPRGERRRRCLRRPPTEPFQSTLPARGATYSDAYIYRSDGISIHAPREGSDRG